MRQTIKTAIEFVTYVQEKMEENVSYRRIRTNEYVGALARLGCLSTEEIYNAVLRIVINDATSFSDNNCCVVREAVKTYYAYLD